METSGIISKKLNSAVYWSGILISAILFAVGHFGLAYASYEKPSFMLLSYIILGNSAGGIIQW